MSFKKYVHENKNVLVELVKMDVFTKSQLELLEIAGVEVKK